MPRAEFPQYTVIIPSYNSAAFLKDAIDSVLAQTVAPAEVVVIDDASTDSSRDIVEEAISAGHPVRHVGLKNNVGPASARNIGLEMCCTPLVAFLDADDTWVNDHIHYLLQLLSQRSDAVLVFGRTLRAADAQPEKPVDVLLSSLLYENPIPQSGVLARCSALLKAGRYTEGKRHGEDFDLWLRLALEGSIVDSGRWSVVRRKHSAQATNNAKKMYAGAWDARIRFYRYMQSRSCPVPEPELLQIFLRTFGRDLREAWGSRDRSLFRFVLALGSSIPEASPIIHEWALREARYWYMWRVASWIWDKLPAGTRGVLRSFPRRSRR